MYAVSYDGRTGDKVYGEPMPESLELRHLELKVGRSTQATLLGRDDVTYEGFYLSPALASLLDANPKNQGPRIRKEWDQLDCCTRMQSL